MKKFRVLLNVSILVVLTFAMLSGCGESKVSDFEEGDVAYIIKGNDLSAPAEIVPRNIGLAELINNPKSTFLQYDQFYREVVLKKIQEPYFENLQIMTITAMAERSKGFDEIPENIARFYIGELTLRKFINNPNALELFLETAERFIDKSEQERIVKRAVAQNIGVVSSSSSLRQSHLEIFKDTYLKLQQRLPEADHWMFDVLFNPQKEPVN